MRSTLLLAALLIAAPLAGCLGDDAPREPGPGATTTSRDGVPGEAEPHVVVAIPDTGINPYHEIYQRPNRTEHPCTYLPTYPCDVPALDLTLDADSFEAAFAQDQEVWEDVEQGQWYWIPGTAFVAVYCDAPYEHGRPTPPIPPGSSDTESNSLCILDDTFLHGTATTSSVLTENEDALLAFSEIRPGRFPTASLHDSPAPVDIYSVSWAAQVPFPAPRETCPQNDGGNISGEGSIESIYVKGAGNRPWSTLGQCWAGNPSVISVGGAYAADDTEEPNATKHADVVSYYCRPVAGNDTLDGYHDFCGTSFSTPTVAGALSKVILEIRRESGYTGALENGTVDPIAGISIADVRSAMNQTASYAPAAKYDNTADNGVQLNEAAPWAQWGWGFYDGWVANATIERLLEEDTSPTKPAGAQAYMEAVYDVRNGLYGDGSADKLPATVLRGVPDR